jgi:hypothetical protein
VRKTALVDSKKISSHRKSKANSNRVYVLGWRVRLRILSYLCKELKAALSFAPDICFAGIKIIKQATCIYACVPYFANALRKQRRIDFQRRLLCVRKLWSNARWKIYTRFSAHSSRETTLQQSRLIKTR